MTTATRLLIHRFRPGTRPRPGPGMSEDDADADAWARLDPAVRNDGALVDADPVADRATALASTGTAEARPVAG